jgi:hypothetical protein
LSLTLCRSASFAASCFRSSSAEGPGLWACPLPFPSCSLAVSTDCRAASEGPLTGALAFLLSSPPRSSDCSFRRVQSPAESASNVSRHLPRSVPATSRRAGRTRRRHTPHRITSTLLDLSSPVTSDRNRLVESDLGRYSRSAGSPNRGESDVDAVDAGPAPARACGSTSRRSGASAFRPATCGASWLASNSITIARPPPPAAEPNVFSRRRHPRPIALRRGSGGAGSCCCRTCSVAADTTGRRSRPVRHR